MPVITQKMIYRSDLRNNPECVYVFGDNVQRVGKGGQAKEMRGEPNAVGVATKWTPGIDPYAYVFDYDLEDFTVLIDLDFSSLFQHAKEGKLIILPEDGLGTGLALLKENAPKTLAYLESKIQELKDTEETVC